MLMLMLIFKGDRCAKNTVMSSGQNWAREATWAWEETLQCGRGKTQETAALLSKAVNSAMHTKNYLPGFGLEKLLDLILSTSCPVSDCLCLFSYIWREMNCAEQLRTPRTARYWDNVWGGIGALRTIIPVKTTSYNEGAKAHEINGNWINQNFLCHRVALSKRIKIQ